MLKIQNFPSENRDLFDCHKGWKEHFRSSFGFFYQIVDTICTMSCMIKKDDTITLHVFDEADAVQSISISGWQKWKLNPQWFLSLRIPHHPLWFLIITKENCQINLSVVSKSSKWMTRWSESRELERNLRIFFSGRIKLNSSNGWLFLLFWLSLGIFKAGFL